MPWLYAAALVCTPLLAVGSLCVGIWLGFRICTRDAALLARFAVDAREARAVAERIEASVESTLASVEHKRATTAAAATRAEKAAARQAAAEQAEQLAPPAELTPRERRRAIARRMNGGNPNGLGA